MSLLNNASFRELFKAALKDPMNVSTIFPSMQFLANALIHHSGMAPGHKVLELGCGSGAVTQHILKRREQLASYTGVELDQGLVEFLRNQYPNTTFLNESAADLSQHFADNSVDTIVSTLPWTLFSSELQEQTLKEIIRILKPGGKFTTFLCLHSLTYPGAPRAKSYFKRHFSSFEKKQTIALNIPPANVYMGCK